MPLVIAIAIRYVIMAAVQLGIWSLLERYGIPLLNKSIEEIMVKFGVSRNDAQDILANKFLQAFEQVGIFAVTLKTKLPIKVAEVLGFTSKGYGLRKIASAIEAKVGTTAISATSKAITTSVEGAKIAEVVATSRSLTLSKVNSVVSLVLKLAAFPVATFYAFAQYIDYAAWQNPYQKTFEGLLGYLGIHPDTPMPKANVVSADIWKRIYSTIEQDKPLGIAFPFSDKDQPYSRQALADVVDEVAANIAKSGGSASYKNVLAAVLPLLQYNGREPRVPTFPYSAPVSNTALSPGQFGGTTLPTTKVFTGIVSQGVVGQGLVFTPRPDDMIDSVAELREAASNNLSSYLNTLLGKIVYEVKVVASVVTKDGFRQSGTTQRIASGTNKDGSTKYKTVTNKFATIIVYALTDKGTRTKLTTIVLGPTNSAKLIVGQNDLRTLETALPSLVTTTDINEIKGIETAGAVTVSTPPAAGGAPVSVPDTASPVVVPAPQPSATASGVKPGAGATTLFEWYQAQGQGLPSVEQRASIYASLGLGQTSFYTGTAEQNAKLLDALKNPPAPPAPAPSPSPSPKPSATKEKVKDVVSYKVKSGDKFSPFTGKPISYSAGTTIYGTYSPAKDYGKSDPNK
jgi:hypothetical protein